MKVWWIALVVFVSLGMVGCGEPASSQGDAAAVRRAKSGDTVMVEYTGKLADGTVFETTAGGEARGITIGQDQVLPAFEKALIGMAPGDQKRIDLAPDQAFGPYRRAEGMIIELDRASLAHTLDLAVGQRLNAAVFQPNDPEERVMVSVTVIDLTEETVTVDANHPLAGKDIYFEIRLVEIL